MQHRTNCLALLFLLLTAMTGSAPATPASPPDQGQTTPRERFLQAERLVKQGEFKQYEQLAKDLGDYPLLPYLEALRLQRSFTGVKPSEIADFLERYDGTPIAWELRVAWLNHLADREKWKTYLAFSRPELGTTHACHRLHALIKAGKQQEVYSQVESLWLHGRSQPKSCDPVFSAWRKAGRLTEQLAWGRIELAMEEGETRLASYLGRFLPKSQGRILEQWLRIHRNPALVSQPSLLQKATAEQRGRILLHGIRRLAWRDPEAAAKTWKRLRDRLLLSEEQRYQGDRTLALALARSEPKGDLDALDRLQPAPGDPLLHESRIRLALALQQWEQAARWIEALPAPLAETERWRYWKARVLEAGGDKAGADDILRQLAKERSYHGFLAADRVKLPYHLADIPLQVDHEALGTLAARPGFRRAGELIQLERMEDARREWEWAIRGLSPDELRLAAKLAQSWSWNDRAIFTLARTGYWDDLELRFPLQHLQRINREAKRLQLDNAWILAVVRQESAFSRDARSPAGALGLMQLMPKTARFIARKTSRKPPKKGELLDPATNIALGSAYLDRVFEELGNHPVLATAAYNAGPHRVRSWLPENPMEADLWIETIPFGETRRYVQRVLSYAVIYEQRLGKTPARMQTRMPRVGSEAALAATSPLSAGSSSL